MKKTLKKYKHLLSLAVVLAGASALFMLGASPALCLAMAGLWQLSQFALSKRCGATFNTVLTPEQLKEFDTLLKSFEGYGSMFKELNEISKMEGGFAAIKKLPELLKSEQKRVDDLQGDLKKLRRLNQGLSNTGVRWVGNIPFVSDECARALAAVTVLQAEKIDGALRSLNRDESTHKRLGELAREFLGIEAKTALTGTEVPLPTAYVPQIIELVFKYGAARQYATVFPLGAGTVKLPRLKAGEDDFGYLGAGTAGMSQAVAEKRVAAELVTFTANKAGGLIRIPYELEEDTFIPLGQFLARYISRQLAKLEDKTLFLGDGSATYANQTGVGAYCATNTDYLVKLDAAKTKVTDITLDDLRAMRGKVNPAVLANMAASGQTSAAYYFHPSMEPLLRSFNKYPNFVIFTNENGKPMFDGYPIHWIGVGATNNGAAQPNAFASFFGDLSFWYLGERGSVRVEISKEVFFASDELAMRALERIDVEAMAVDAMVTLQLGAGA